MSSWVISLLIIAIIICLMPLFKSFYYSVLHYNNVRKRRRRADALFAINPHRAHQPSFINSRLKQARRLLFLTRQNTQLHEDKVKFIYGNVFELDNSIFVDTSKVYDVNIPGWKQVVQHCETNAKLNWLKNTTKTIVRELAKSTSLFVKHQIKSITKRINKIQKAVTRYIHNNEGDVNHAKK